jgi:hypothetical protein
MKTTTVRLPDGLMALAKKKAREQGTTVTALVARGLREVLNERPRARPRRVKLPVSAAKGGLIPGIDPGKIQSYADELDDIDRRTLINP